MSVSGLRKESVESSHSANVMWTARFASPQSLESSTNEQNFSASASDKSCAENSSGTHSKKCEGTMYGLHGSVRSGSVKFSPSQIMKPLFSGHVTSTSSSEEYPRIMSMSSFL